MKREPNANQTDARWTVAEVLLRRACKDPEEAILLIKWAERLQNASRRVCVAFFVQVPRSRHAAMKMEIEALSGLDTVVVGMFTDRLAYEEEGRLIPVPPCGTWFNGESLPTCASCGDAFLPPGIDGKCAACGEDAVGPTFVGTNGQANWPPAPDRGPLIPPLAELLAEESGDPFCSKCVVCGLNDVDIDEGMDTCAVCKP